MIVEGSGIYGNKSDLFSLFSRAGQAKLQRASSLNALQVMKLALVMLLQLSSHKAVAHQRNLKQVHLDSTNKIKSMSLEVGLEI